MSPEAIGAVGLVAAALIAAGATVYAHHSSARREDRKQAREAFYAARKAWDQSQSQQLRDETSAGVLAERVQEARRELSRVKSILREVATQEFERLLALLGLPLLEPSYQQELEEATGLWAQVEVQIVAQLSDARSRRREAPALSSA